MRTLLALITTTCLAEVVLAQPSSEVSRPGPEYKALEVWTGDWAYEREDKESPIGPADKFSGTLTIKWVLNGSFQEWKYVDKKASGNLEGIEFDWYDSATRRFPWQGYDSSGAAYSGSSTVKGNTWNWTSVVNKNGIQYQVKGVAILAPNGRSYTEKSELSADGKTWVANFERKATRAASTGAPAGQELTNISTAGKMRVAAVEQPTAALQELGDLLVGRWTSDVTWAVDYPGLGKKGEKVTGFDVWKWTVDGAALECDWLLGATCGRTVMWWDASAKQIRVLDVDSGGNWSQGTMTKQGTKWVWATAGSFADGRRVEYQSETTFPDNGRSRVTAGATILDDMRNEFRDVFRRVGN